jgi:hypothetical protein
MELLMRANEFITEKKKRKNQRKKLYSRSWRGGSVDTGGDGGGGESWSSMELAIMEGGHSLELEAAYEGNIGIMELMKFFQSAPKELVVQVKELISQKKDKEVWKIVQSYTGTKLKGKEFEVDENFADGKKPGRKGLAKRSGVNTKDSVSSLRKTAKNSTGEKARMAHWLANMKAGKAKK